MTNRLSSAKTKKLLGLFALLGCVNCGWCFEPPQKNLPVTINADQLRYDPEEGGYHAEGDVILQQGKWRLFSDQILWNPENDDVRGEGGVRLSDEQENSLSGDAFQLNLKSGEGWLRNSRAFVREKNFHLAADMLYRLDENNYTAKEATFTTCDGDKPSWHFRAKDLKVTVGDYAQGKHAFFYIGDVPVFYLPYLAYPVSERKTGLLIPKYGYSEKRGFQMFQPFYWAISRNTDATFHLDYLSRLGVGKGVDYRYIFRNDNKGYFNVYHVNGFDEGGDRLAYIWRHTGFLPGNVRVVANMEYADEKDYFEDFGQEAEEYNKNSVQTVLFAQRNWGKLNLSSQIKYIKDLEKRSGVIAQRLPETRLSLIRQRLTTSPIYYGFDASHNYFWRRDGEDGNRLMARPYLGAVFKPGNIVELETEVGGRERVYWDSEYDTNLNSADLSVAASSRLSRVYMVNGRRIKKLRHVIQPEVRYSYDTSDSQHSVPQFDYLDNIEAQNKISYALVNRLTARMAEENGQTRYHEFLWLRLGQEYDIHELRDPGDEHVRPFSALRTELIVRPTTWSYLDTDTLYDVNPDGRHFEIVRCYVGVHDSRGNGLSTGYSYRDERYEYLQGTVNTTLLAPLFLSYSGRFDLKDDKELEHVLRAEWRFQCWSLFVTFRDREDDREVMFSFALKGLGREFGI
jgi:LPS-assembly protein